jgi:hypothetical protein
MENKKEGSMAMEMGGEDGIYFGDEWTGLFPMRSV